MVWATVAFKSVITRTPRKLKKAAIKIAARGLMERVETQVAMALGASVQPLTKITPKVRITVTTRPGLESIWDTKSGAIPSWLVLPSLNMKFLYFIYYIPD